MMLGGAIGFYLGIDTPPLPFHADRSRRTAIGSARSTRRNCSARSARSSRRFRPLPRVGVIVLRHDPHIAWTWMIMAGWVVGVTMQIVAGAIARLRR